MQPTDFDDARTREANRGDAASQVITLPSALMASKVHAVTLILTTSAIRSEATRQESPLCNASAQVTILLSALMTAKALAVPLI